MTTTTMPVVPDSLPAGVRLRCLNCGTQWKHGAWEEAPKGASWPLPGACPMCNMLINYAICAGRSSRACGFYELSDTEVHYDY